MIPRPDGVGAFEFVIMAALRASQLMRGCTPRVNGDHKATTTAQLELSCRKVSALVAPEMPVNEVPAATL